MKELSLDDERTVYIYVRFKIKLGAVTKLIDFLKQNTKTFNCWWKDYPIGKK